MDVSGKAVWFIESHLGSPISLSEVARACGVSPFHLTRAFNASRGTPLMRYVRARRLSQAAQALSTGATDILGLALDAGYNSHEAFTRAFREQFALTPTEVRDRGHLEGLQLVEAKDMTTKTPTELTQPRFEKSPERLIVGMMERHDCAKPRGIPGQWERFGPHIGQLPGEVAGLAYGISYDFDDEGMFSYLCGVEIKTGIALPRGFSMVALESEHYAVFRHDGHIASVRNTFSAIWNEWLPKSKYEAVEAPFFEAYGREFDPLTGNGGLDLWIPVRLL